MTENKQLDEQFEMGVAVGINLMKENCFWQQRTEHQSKLMIVHGG